MAEEEGNEGQGQEQAAAKPAASGEKIPLQTRVIAGVIDFVVVGVASTVLQTIGGMIWWALGGILGSAAGAGYWLLRDSILGNGQSVGKKVMKYQVVGPDGKPCSQELSIKRNLPFALGSLIGLVISILVAIPVVGVFLAFLGGLVALILWPVTLLVSLAEVYFVHSDPQGNRWGDKFAGTTTKMVG